MQIIAGVRGSLRGENYKVDLQAARHALVADEPVSQGGANAGPAPYQLVLSGLVACTAITLRMYAQRKGWKLAAVDVEARMYREGDKTHVARSLSLQGELDAEQKARLLEISEKTPVTLTLKNGMGIATSLQDG